MRASAVLALACCAVVGVVMCLSEPAAAVHCDPASSWLAYATYNTSGEIITYLSAEWVLPEDPRTNGGSPAFWFGIEPNPACWLIQPISKWTLTKWGTWNEYYEWDIGYDYQSPHRAASAGDVIFASVAYNATTNAYDMITQNLSNGALSQTSIPIVEDVVYSNAFFVIEHQVNRCSQMPASGSLQFANITLEVANQPVAAQWDAVVGNTVCSCKASVVDSATIDFTWLA